MKQSALVIAAFAIVYLLLLLGHATSIDVSINYSNKTNHLVDFFPGVNANITILVRKKRFLLQKYLLKKIFLKEVGLKKLKSKVLFFG